VPIERIIEERGIKLRGRIEHRALGHAELGPRRGCDS
jgi:hypothetical protein